MTKDAINTRFIRSLSICIFSLLILMNTGFSQPIKIVFPGADEKTPSQSEYFSWINNTNEETTEKQTLSNFGFFQWLHDEYGMILDIYAFDAVCGDLRDNKQDAFTLMMTECRKYSPDLVLLNHRLNLGDEAIKHATTWLLGGAETYIDVHMTNNPAATHHRVGALSRKIVPELQRLTEDHGVCISSCLDYWEDDLVLHAFNRNLILAPEIYGNPWLLREDEYPRLARIFNLTRKYKEILVNGIILPGEKYGEKAVSRGDEKTRLITLRNLSWEPVIRTIKLDKEIGLGKGPMVELRQYHPAEKVIGRFKKGQTVDIEVLPFRSALLQATSEKLPDPSIEGDDYEIVRGVTGKPLKINLLAFPGEMKSITFHCKGISFKQSNLDGKPARISEVKKARDAFFDQELFVGRGLWDRFLFDGDLKTSFYPSHRRGITDSRIYGGAFRLDLGEVTKLDSLRITIGDEQALQPFKSFEAMKVQTSSDLKSWSPVQLLAGKVMTVLLEREQPSDSLRKERTNTFLKSDHLKKSETGITESC
jgi:hypothetical protein